MTWLSRKPALGLGRVRREPPGAGPLADCVPGPDRAPAQPSMSPSWAFIGRAGS